MQIIFVGSVLPRIRLVNTNCSLSWWSVFREGKGWLEIMKLVTKPVCETREEMKEEDCEAR